MWLLSSTDLPVSDLTESSVPTFRVIRESNVVVRVVGIEQYRRCASLRSLAVEASHRGRGYGAHLVSEAEMVKP